MLHLQQKRVIVPVVCEWVRQLFDSDNSLSSRLEDLPTEKPHDEFQPIHLNYKTFRKPKTQSCKIHMFLIAFYYLHQLICDDLGAAKTNCKHKTCIFSLYKVDMANLANTCLFKNPASHGETLAFFWGHVCVHLMNINSMLTLLELCFVLLQIFIKNISGALAAKCSTTDQI